MSNNINLIGRSNIAAVLANFIHTYIRYGSDIIKHSVACLLQHLAESNRKTLTNITVNSIPVGYISNSIYQIQSDDEKISILDTQSEITDRSVTSTPLADTSDSIRILNKILNIKEYKTHGQILGSRINGKTLNEGLQKLSNLNKGLRKFANRNSLTIEHLKVKYLSLPPNVLSVRLNKCKVKKIDCHSPVLSICIENNQFSTIICNPYKTCQILSIGGNSPCTIQDPDKWIDLNKIIIANENFDFFPIFSEPSSLPKLKVISLHKDLSFEKKAAIMLTATLKEFWAGEEDESGEFKRLYKTADSLISFLKPN